MPKSWEETRKMAEFQDRTEDAALWRRWRSAAGPDAPIEPDSLLLAAYADNRLEQARVDQVEEWLAQHPEALEDILAARRAAQSPLPQSAPAAVARAAALVSPGGAQVLAFPRPAARWRSLAAWGCMAASLVMVSVIGFNLGSDVYATLSGGGTGALSQELLDPSGFLSNADEDSSI
jgi:anti-sigma factor RsiW